MQPALQIANEVMSEICAEDYNWKWNSFLVPPFCTISWQNDYALPGITTLGWLENGYALDVNSSQIPKRKYKMEVVKDLQSSSDAWGRPFQIAWEPVGLLNYGSWGTGATVPNTNNTGQTNPGPGVVYTQPLGATTTPSNPVTQIIDPNGNIEVVTTYGTCGSAIPAFPSASAAPGTQTVDGTNPGATVWTVIDPYSQGFRLQNIPAQAGNVWQINLRAQFKPVKFTSLQQSLNPVPDDFIDLFMQGFRAKCYQRSPETKIRQKFTVEYSLWKERLLAAKGKDSREEDSFGFYPSDDIMSSGLDLVYPRADWPYGPYGS